MRVGPFPLRCPQGPQGIHVGYLGQGYWGKTISMSSQFFSSSLESLSYHRVEPEIELETSWIVRRIINLETDFLVKKGTWQFM